LEQAGMVPETFENAHRQCRAKKNAKEQAHDTLHGESAASQWAGAAS